MPHNAIQKAISLDREAAYGDGLADHDSPSGNGGLLYFTSENFAGVRQGVIDNRNYKKRPAAKHAKLLGLKSGSEVPLEMYMYGGAVNAAEGAQSARILRDEVFIGALAGEVRGYSAGIAGGTAAVPTVDTTQLDSQATYSWGLFSDTSSGIRRFRKFSTVTDGGMGMPDALNMLPDHALHFTPDGGGADRMYACVHHYPWFDAMEDHTHANHLSHTFFRKGRHAEDSVETLGCQIGIGQLVVTAGERPSLQIPVKVGNFVDPESITQPDLTGTPSGVPGKTVGSGTETVLEMEALGTDLGTNARQFWGSITYNFGITYSPYDGPNGEEGIHGWGVEEAAYEAQTVEVTVPFDDDWMVGFRAETRYHMLLQVGNTSTNTWGVYCCRLAFAEEPEPTSHNGRKALILRFEMLEDESIDVSALTEPAISRAKAKFEFMRSA